MVFLSTLSFTDLPILCIKRKISRGQDRYSCPAVISYASVPCKHVLQTPGHSGTALGKTEEHCIRNAVASLASPAFHQISEPQQRQAAMDDGRGVHK